MAFKQGFFHKDKSEAVNVRIVFGEEMHFMRRKS